MFATTAATVVLASAVIVYSLRQESVEGRDPPDGERGAPAVPVGTTVAVATPPAGGEAAKDEGAGRGTPGAPGGPSAGGSQPSGEGSAVAAGAVPSEGTPPSLSSSAIPDAGAPTGDSPGSARRGSSSPGGAASGGADAGAAGGGTPSSGASRSSAGAASRASARMAHAAHSPDGGVAAAAGGAHAPATSGAGALAQGEGGGSPGTPAPDGGVAVASRAAVPRGRTSGVATAEGEPSTGQPAARGGTGPGGYNGPTALERKLAALERTRSDEEGALRQVERFVPTGGVTLTGRVVDADGGKPIVGSEVHVDHEGALVEGTTDATGAFKLPGMVAGSHVIVWVGRAGDPYIDERLELAVPGAGDTTDTGTLKLLRGDELAAKHEGWVGLFVNRRGGQIVVAGVTPWTPADEARLEVGDQLVSIDGRDLAGLGPRAVTYLLRGRVGTPVAVVVRSPGGQRRKLTLARAVR